MLFTIANCSLEWTCQQLLAEESLIAILLPFCKSSCFGVSLGAKSSLSSICAYIPRVYWQWFLKVNQPGLVAIVNSLREFAKSGDYKKLFRTPLGIYYFSTVDLLLFLNALVANPLNLEDIQLSSIISSVLSQFLANGIEQEKNIVVEILWKLSCNRSLRPNVLSNLPPSLKQQLPTEVFGNEKFLPISSDTSELDYLGKPYKLELILA